MTRIRLHLFVAVALSALWACTHGSSADDRPTSVQAMILSPLHHSVARRQSLHIDVDIIMDGGLADVYGVLSIDGNSIAHLNTFPVRSIVGNVSDGVHNITFAAVGAQNQILHEVTHEIQVAVNWAASHWHVAELFIWSPVDGDFFALHTDDRMHDVSVRVSVHYPLSGQPLEVFLDGEFIRSFPAENVSFSVPAVGTGSHLLSVICGDAQATAVFVVQMHPHPMFIPQPPDAKSVGFFSLPPQSRLQHRPGPSLQTISICILAFPGSNKRLALLHTLKSLKSSGLIPLAELLVFVQGLDDDLVDAAREFDAHVLGFGRPIGKGNAWRLLALAASRPLVLLLEEDFSVVASPQLALEVGGTAELSLILTSIAATHFPTCALCEFLLKLLTHPCFSVLLPPAFCFWETPPMVP